MIHLNRACIWYKSRQDFPDVQIHGSSMQILEKEKAGSSDPASPVFLART